MIKRFMHESKTVGDAALRDVLTRYDSVVPLSAVDLGALEADILARIDGLDEGASITAPWMLGGLFPQGLTLRAAAFTSVLIVVVGFVAGQTTYSGTNVAFIAPSSLLAFTDDTAVPVTNNAWGDTDDTAE